MLHYNYLYLSSNSLSEAWLCAMGLLMECSITLRFFQGIKTLKQNMIKYFHKTSLGGSDRVVRRKEMVLSCRRKYSVALVVDLH